MTDTARTSLLNELFLEKVSSAASREKFSASASDLVRDRIRESSFIEGVFPTRSISKDDPNVQVSDRHDTLVYVVEVEPDATAMSMSFRTNPDVNYVTGQRLFVAFHTIGSPRFEKSEEELWAYRIPIMDVIKRFMVKDMEDVKDRIGLMHLESAVQALQRSAMGIGYTAALTELTTFTAYNIALTAGTVVPEVGKCKSVDVLNHTAALDAVAGCDEDLNYPVQRDDMIKLKKLFTGYGTKHSGRMRVNRILISDTDLEDTNSWSAAEIGDAYSSSRTVDGAKSSPKFLGVTFIRTIKTDILRPGNIWGLAEESYLGGQRRIDKIKFYTEKVRNRISMECWEHVAAYIANVAGARKLELYAGSSETTDTAGDNPNTRAAYTPVAESNIGTRNNLVEEGQTFPQVTPY